MADEEDTFLVELRRAAQRMEAGPAPVDSIVRRGRKLRARRRALALGGAGAAGVLAVVLATAPAWWGGENGGQDGEESVTDPPVATSPGEVREVGPEEPVVVNDDLVLGLLAEGRQNYFFTEPDTFEEAADEARGVVGDSINPESLSLDITTEQGVPLAVSGSWRLGEGRPSRVEVVSEETTTTYEATVVALEGADWGVWFLDPERLPDLSDGYRVVAYDAEGEPFDERRWPSFP
ncbi:hypothetical protein SAMN06297387_12347 [Streptomyces zhaozhouensis]|uniref:Uncharacterized protein n=1 Tax=Streptomyces zhaozhouensis TaxID=1300267 RepID=A0A286E4G1_9ACTN|nr:hypothetical protein [Streptomyces zhaozhouensis]SOD65783.1 hypothetical protein SAMN06297387_12347 [Streptomyces zhaozhouensis]